MKPSWNDFKKVLRWHEEISQSNSSNLHPLSNKFGDFDQALADMIISKNEEIEVALTTPNKRMDGMDLKFNI
jgi:hypothetical protein